jgi:nicotinate-nucleotide adenylyltransferase
VRIGLMGGTFDPIHIAHLVAASEVQSSLNLDQVVFIPAGQPWQKIDVPISPAETRLQMVDLAIAENPQFISSDIEIKRPGNT